MAACELRPALSAKGAAAARCVAPGSGFGLGPGLGLDVEGAAPLRRASVGRPLAACACSGWWKTTWVGVRGWG
eukprot:scaffold100112_cov36-Phaeocystis_antarctica.AAC.1